MEQKDRYIFFEFLFTFALLNSVIFLFGPGLAGYELYLAPGLISGFFFSWFIRNKQNSLIKGIINIGILGVFVWMLYYIGTAPWFYTDIILMLVKAGIFLEIILSFNSSSPAFLAYMQALSLPLFMGSPLFIKNYDLMRLVLILIYLICWAAILRLKFYEFFRPSWEKSLRQRHSFLISAAFFLIILIFSWVIFSSFLLEKVRLGGEGAFIYEESKGALSDGDIEKQFYDAQDRAQKGIADSINEVANQGDKEGILEALSSLIGSENITEIRKAEQGLVDYLRRPGPGLEERKTQETVSRIKEFSDAKIRRNIKLTKDKIFYTLVKNAFRITERIGILSRATEMRHSNDYQQIREKEKQIQKIIDKSSVNMYAKNELKKLVGELKALKALETYREKMVELKNKIDFLEEQLRKEFVKLYRDMEQAESASDLKKVGNKIKILRNTMPLKAQDILNSAEEILDIMSDFIVPEEIRKLKGKLNLSEVSMDKMMEIEKALEDIKNMQDFQRFLDGPLNAEGKFKETGTPLVLDSVKKLVMIKIIPDYLKIPLGENSELVAYGIFDDDTEEDLTYAAEWPSTDSGIVSVSKGKIFTHSVGEVKIHAEFAGIRSLPATVIVEPAKLISIVLTPEKSELSMQQGQKLDLKAEGYYSDASYKDITPQVAWEFTKGAVVSVEKGLVRPLKIGRTQVYAVYSEIKSNPVNVRVIFTLEWLLWTIFKIFSILILSIIIIFAILYFLTQREKKKIKNLLADNPQEFIIRLYENIRKILPLFGLGRKEFLPPFAYAEFIQQRCFIKNSPFFNLTKKFTEAKYSRHILRPADAQAALEDYNSFLAILFHRHNKFSLFYKYCLNLLLRRPLFVK